MLSLKNIQSLTAVLLISVAFFSYRYSYTPQDKSEFTVTTWDAFGYYAYLPGLFIYNDLDKLQWVEEIDKKYDVTRGGLYQFRLHENGNYVGKYFVGISILQSPFFLTGHAIAKFTDYPADGFSPPYQYSLAFGVLLYTFLALLLLRNILLRFYSDRVTSITLLFLCLASNLIQYVSIDGIQSHSYIFLLYALVLYFTLKWHEQPKLKWAMLIGLTIGLATICRPTELIMLFIPLLWSTENKKQKALKWGLVKKNINHLYWVVGFGFMGVLPQIIYWKSITGSIIYDVGSSWRFLTPFFRVLFGFENGWFIYTPITLFFIAGFFFIRKFPFKRSVIVFSLLNIWIVISWADWKYGGTYATRALVQSYPVLALAFAGFIQYIETKKFKYIFYLIGLYLIFVNLFQIEQYNKTILHYRDMNRLYYSRIFLNNSPNSLDMSAMDTDEILSDKASFKKELLLKWEGQKINNSDSVIIFHADQRFSIDEWIEVKVDVQLNSGFENAYLECTSESGSINIKQRRFRVDNPITWREKLNTYNFYYKIPESEKKSVFKLKLVSSEFMNGKLKNIIIKRYFK